MPENMKKRAPKKARSEETLRAILTRKGGPMGDRRKKRPKDTRRQREVFEGYSVGPYQIPIRWVEVGHAGFEEAHLSDHDWIGTLRVEDKHGKVRHEMSVWDSTSEDPLFLCGYIHTYQGPKLVNRMRIPEGLMDDFRVDSMNRILKSIRADVNAAYRNYRKAR